jgi:hypothetical protein
MPSNSTKTYHTVAGHVASPLLHGGTDRIPNQRRCTSSRPTYKGGVAFVRWRTYNDSKRTHTSHLQGRAASAIYPIRKTIICSPRCRMRYGSAGRRRLNGLNYR